MCYDRDPSAFDHSDPCQDTVGRQSVGCCCEQPILNPAAGIEEEGDSVTYRQLRWPPRRIAACKSYSGRVLD
jgi:hypothetical protein